ncbi:hypothetical protein MNB_ARC-1_203 [hydrothermal vent metagenome]|uniref:Uncharacterized protein n=1 Tax=hydrothermal vent metagenome TaxID=652676 RepID=A0A3B1E1C6_9ZZZZ
MQSIFILFAMIFSLFGFMVYHKTTYNYENKSIHIKHISSKIKYISLSTQFYNNNYKDFVYAK